MFKYNELSDLLDGTLVKPLSKMEDGSIRCIDSNGNECFYEFDDFDFDKLPEERMPSLEDQLENDEDKNEDTDDDNIDDILPSDTNNENNNPTIKDIIDEINIDDSTYDGTDDTEIIEDLETVEDEEKEGLLTKEEIIKNASYLNIDKNKTQNIWRDII